MAEADPRREGGSHGHARGLASGADGVPARGHHGDGIRSVRHAARARAGGGERDRHDLPARGVPPTTGQRPDAGAASRICAPAGHDRR